MSSQRSVSRSGDSPLVVNDSDFLDTRGRGRTNSILPALQSPHSSSSRPPRSFGPTAAEPLTALREEDDDQDIVTSINKTQLAPQQSPNNNNFRPSVFDLPPPPEPSKTNPTSPASSVSTAGSPSVSYVPLDLPPNTRLVPSISRPPSPHQHNASSPPLSNVSATQVNISSQTNDLLYSAPSQTTGWKRPQARPVASKNVPNTSVEQPTPQIKTHTPSRASQFFRSVGSVFRSDKHHQQQQQQRRHESTVSPPRILEAGDENGNSPILIPLSGPPPPSASAQYEPYNPLSKNSPTFQSRHSASGPRNVASQPSNSSGKTQSGPTILSTRQSSDLIKSNSSSSCDSNNSDVYDDVKSRPLKKTPSRLLELAKKAKTDGSRASVAMPHHQAAPVHTKAGRPSVLMKIARVHIDNAIMASINGDNPTIVPQLATSSSYHRQSISSHNNTGTNNTLTVHYMPTSNIGDDRKQILDSVLNKLRLQSERLYNPHAEHSSTSTKKSISLSSSSSIHRASVSIPHNIPSHVSLVGGAEFLQHVGDTCLNEVDMIPPPPLSCDAPSQETSLYVSPLFRANFDPSDFALVPHVSAAGFHGKNDNMGRLSVSMNGFISEYRLTYATSNDDTAIIVEDDFYSEPSATTIHSSGQRSPSRYGGNNTQSVLTSVNESLHPVGSNVTVSTHGSSDTDKTPGTLYNNNVVGCSLTTVSHIPSSSSSSSSNVSPNLPSELTARMFELYAHEKEKYFSSPSSSVSSSTSSNNNNRIDSLLLDGVVLHIDAIRHSSLRKQARTLTFTPTVLHIAVHSKHKCNINPNKPLPIPQWRDKSAQQQSMSSSSNSTSAGSSTSSNLVHSPSFSVPPPPPCDDIADNDGNDDNDDDEGSIDHLHDFDSVIPSPPSGTPSTRTSTINQPYSVDIHTLPLYEPYNETYSSCSRCAGELPELAEYDISTVTCAIPSQKHKDSFMLCFINQEPHIYQVSNVMIIITLINIYLSLSRQRQGITDLNKTIALIRILSSSSVKFAALRLLSLQQTGSVRSSAQMALTQMSSYRINNRILTHNDIKLIQSYIVLPIQTKISLYNQCKVYTPFLQSIQTSLAPSPPECDSENDTNYNRLNTIIIGQSNILYDILITAGELPSIRIDRSIRDPNNELTPVIASYLAGPQKNIISTSLLTQSLTSSSSTASSGSATGSSSSHPESVPGDSLLSKPKLGVLPSPVLEAYKGDNTPPQCLKLDDSSTSNSNTSSTVSSPDPALPQTDLMSAPQHLLSSLVGSSISTNLRLVLYTLQVCFQPNIYSSVSQLLPSTSIYNQLSKWSQTAEQCLNILQQVIESKSYDKVQYSKVNLLVTNPLHGSTEIGNNTPHDKGSNSSSKDLSESLDKMPAHSSSLSSTNQPTTSSSHAFLPSDQAEWHHMFEEPPYPSKLKREMATIDKEGGVLLYRVKQLTAALTQYINTYHYPTLLSLAETPLDIGNKDLYLKRLNLSKTQGTLDLDNDVTIAIQYAVELIITPNITPLLDRFLDIKYCSKNYKLYKTCIAISSRSQNDFGIPYAIQSPDKWTNAVHILRKLPLFTCASERLQCLLDTAKSIYTTYKAIVSTRIQAYQLLKVYLGMDGGSGITRLNPTCDDTTNYSSNTPTYLSIQDDNQHKLTFNAALCEKYPLYIPNTDTNNNNNTNIYDNNSTIDIINKRHIDKDTNLEYILINDNPNSIDSLCADDFFPIFVYVVVNARLSQLESMKQFIASVAPRVSLTGEAGYYFTVFEAVIEYIETLDPNTF